jgi:membrane protein YqaA with SNARE-associated domain
MAWWKLAALPALVKLGAWGAFAVALLDSSTIPVPMDAILAVYVWNNKPHFWLYCTMAAAGSAIGGLLLLKRIDRVKFEKLRARFESQEILAVMIPSMLPPPTPWKMFVFAAGVFEMRVPAFLIAVFAGRMLRWLILSALVLTLGPGAVQLVAHHAGPLVLAVCGLAAIGFGWWWMRKKRAGKLS